MSKTSFPLVGIALDHPVKPLKNKTRDIKIAKAKIRRVVRKAPEVLVKVSGGTRGAKHMKSHMDYITRNGNIEAESERGEVIDSRERLREVHKEWVDDLGKPRKNERDTINLVLSMPAGTDSQAVLRAAREFAKAEFRHNHQYLMALHSPENDLDTKNPHVHLTVKALGYDGSKLDPKKAHLAHWRELFAEKMREQGYEAEATPRRSRGVVQKGTHQVIHALEHKQGRPGSRVQAEKLREAGAALTGKQSTANPAREKIVETQKAVRKSWLDGAAELERSTDPNDVALAKEIREFVQGMPRQLQDEREAMKARLMKQVEERRQQLKTPGQEAQSHKDQGVER